MTENAPRSAESAAPLSIGALREAIINATELGGAYGQNIHESKQVALRVGGIYYPLAQVSVGFIAGSFVLILQGGAPQRSDGSGVIR